jgi:indole-3-glycerol phosphate synthase
MNETVLERIVRHKQAEIAKMPDIADPPRCLKDSMHAFTPRPGLIAEIKAASPSEGDIVNNFDPLAIAQSYIDGGATAISVLTDQHFFKGGFDILRSIRALTDKPLLCKDFILSEKQIRFARLHGADMCLLIVKILERDQLLDLKTKIESLGMEAVIEIQNETELDIALSLDPAIILINNRNLDSFAVDLGTANRLAGRIPAKTKIIAASGIRSPNDLRGFSDRMDAFLIGTALMSSPDKAEFLRRCHAAKN